MLPQLEKDSGIEGTIGMRPESLDIRLYLFFREIIIEDLVGVFWPVLDVWPVC
jgi:hypothetical protein